MAVSPTKLRAPAIDLPTVVSADSDNALSTDSNGLLKVSKASAVTSSGTGLVPVSLLYTALGGRVAIATDSEPTSGSSNFLTSGTIHTALASKGSGTITGVSANGTSVATSGVANIPAATTSAYGVTQLTNSISSTSTTTAAVPAAVKSAYDIHNTAFTSATVSTSTYSQSISATSSCRFKYTQTASACTYTFTPAVDGYVWYVIIEKTSGSTVAFNSNINMTTDVDASWTYCELVFIANTTSNITGHVLRGE